MARLKGTRGKNMRPVVVKKEEVIAESRHGGAWKVAYADFVTAMMAFFLLMWLINATTVAQRIGLADYFSQANVLNRGASGEGKPFGGSDPFDTGALASNLGTVQIMPGRHQPQSIHPPLPHPQSRQPATGQAPAATPASAPSTGGQPAQAAQTGPAGPARQNAQEAAFRSAAAQMRSVIDSDKAVSAYAGQISISTTPQGIKIQIIDSRNQPMFAVGSAALAPNAYAILGKIAPILARLGHPISIAGYTDARPYAAPSQNNWLLSVERADATRAALVGAGLPESDLAQVAGYADRQLLHPEDPLADSNRRITITIAKDEAAAFGPTQ